MPVAAKGWQLPPSLAFRGEKPWCAERLFASVAGGCGGPVYCAAVHMAALVAAPGLGLTENQGPCSGALSVLEGAHNWFEGSARYPAALSTGRPYVSKKEGPPGGSVRALPLSRPIA